MEFNNTIASIIASLNTKVKTEDSRSQSDYEDLDQQFEDSNKKHRNWISNFDHWYERISHPFMIVLVLIFVLIVFLTFRYLEINHSSTLFSRISNDAGTALTYLFTIVATSIFTKYFERRKK